MINVSIRAKVIGKTIDTSEIKRMFVQGESEATTIDFVLRPEHAGLQWTIRGVMEYYGTVALQILTVTETETEVVVSWPVSNLFTVGNGLMHLSLVGARENGTVVVKAVGNVEVKQDYSVDTMPTVTPNLFEQLMAEIEGAEAEREAAEEAREENEAGRQAEIEKLANMEVELTALEPEETPTSSLTDTGAAFLLALGLPRGQRGPQGDTGAQGVSAYVHIRYAAAQPTQDGDMKQSPDAWIGIYAGVSAEAPTAYTSYAWYQYKGATGDTGPQGATGETGAPGAGVPVGGTTGQVLLKASAADRDTEWGNLPEKASTLTALLDADDWIYSVDHYQQTIAISGLAVSGYCYIVSAAPDSAGEYAKRGVLMQDVTVANTATFYAASAPDTDITAYIAKIQEG